MITTVKHEERSFKDLERIVELMAPPFKAVDKGAPNTFEELLEYKDKDILLVYSGGSDKTIWSTPQINFSFRAWHDSIHMRKGYDFSVLGEVLTAREHIMQLKRAGFDRFCNLFWIDIVAQRLFYAKYGRYVQDQEAFFNLMSKYNVKVDDIQYINYIFKHERLDEKEY